MPQINPKVTNIAVPVTGADPVIIVGTMMASKVEIQEDPALNAGTAQGLAGYYMDPDSNHAAPARDLGGNAAPVKQNWLANTQGQIGQAYQPIVFGGADGRVHGAFGNYTSAPGTPLLSLNSLTATATGILLVEWP